MNESAIVSVLFLFFTQIRVPADNSFLYFLELLSFHFYKSGKEARKEEKEIKREEQ